jgi:peptidoglycan/xylan/chitin deacetylase (PgdA/CDA1 family)
MYMPGIINRINNNSPVILMYHSISDGSYQVTAENFEAQIKYLRDNGFTFLFPEEIHDAGKYNKSVIITFDDGYRDNYETAFPVLKKYDAKAALFMITDNIGKENYLTGEQIIALESSGLVRVEPHTRTHTDLTQISREGARSQIESSNAALRELTGREPRVFAYPYGGFNDEIKAIAAEYYDMAFAVGNGSPDDIMALKRISVSNNMTVFKISAASRGQLILAAALPVIFIIMAAACIIISYKKIKEVTHG